MARDSRSFWARLHWWDKLEMVGAVLIFLFIVIAGVDETLARSILYAVTDFLRTVIN